MDKDAHQLTCIPHVDRDRGGKEHHGEDQHEVTENIIGELQIVPVRRKARKVQDDGHNAEKDAVNNQRGAYLHERNEPHVEVQFFHEIGVLKKGIGARAERIRKEKPGHNTGYHPDDVGGAVRALAVP